MDFSGVEVEGGRAGGGGMGGAGRGVSGESLDTQEGWKIVVKKWE